MLKLQYQSRFALGRRLQAAAASLSIAALVMALLAMTGCASIPKSTLESDPALYLQRVPQLYLRLDGQTARDITKILGVDRVNLLLAGAMASQNRKASIGLDKASMDAFLNRTSQLAFGLSGIDQNKLAWESIFLGNFPPDSMHFALGMNRDWQKEAGGFVHSDSGIHMRMPLPGAIRLSAAPLEEDPSQQRAASMLPARAAAYKSSDILVWIENPGAVLGRYFFGEALDIPLESLAFTAKCADAAQDKGLYRADSIFFMKDEASASTFKPVIRFLWAALANRLLGEGSAAAYPIVMEGDRYIVRSMPIRLAVIAQAIAAPLAVSPVEP